MQIYAEKLAETLAKGLSPAYLIFGNEPLLLEEATAQVEQQAKMQGFDEIYRFTADASIDWAEVFDRCQSMSLFSSRQILEILIPESGPGASVTTQLLALTERLNPDILLLIRGQKITKAQENAKWFKTLAAQGCHVNCLTPDRKRLPLFVKTRCRKLKLSPDQEAIQLLAQWHEGNLFALSQSLEKLALLYPDGQLTRIRLEESLSKHHHFTPFHWVDALLEGKANRSQKILRQLEMEGVEPVILLRTIQKELTLLWKLSAKQPSKPLATLFHEYRVWNNRRPIYTQALARLSIPQLTDLIGQLKNIEYMVKTQYSENPWLKLQQFSIDFSHLSHTVTSIPSKHGIIR